MKQDRDYTYYEFTMSLCSECLNTVPAKIIIKNNGVYLLKYCKEHGEKMELLEEDVEYFLRKREMDKPATISKTQTVIDKGCPYDCGLCPQHDQHSCIALIEITNNCDLNCPVCYANSCKDGFLSLEKIEEMMDFWRESENGNAEILQISGGEPTTHPQILEIIKLAMSKDFRYVMLNTNGLRIAKDEEFAKQLKQFIGGFEVYLQFDGFSKKTYEYFRGKDLSDIKKKAIENLTKYCIPTTLVCTIEENINDDQLGQIVEFGINTKYIRGINFQPVAYFGRIKEKSETRVTLSGVINRIDKQTNGMIKKSDFIPLPCDVERVAITYLYKSNDGFIPITRNTKVKDYLSIINSTFAFNIEDMLKENLNSSCCDLMQFLKDFKKMIPLNFALKSKEERIAYVDQNTFRISVSYFVDAYNFDMKSMQKECVHVITPDLKKIPFSAYNMIHRKER